MKKLIGAALLVSLGLGVGVRLAHAGEDCAPLLELRDGILIQDMDGSGDYNPINEAIRLLNWHFLGAAAPPVPPCVTL